MRSKIPKNTLYIRFIAVLYSQIGHLNVMSESDSVLPPFQMQMEWNDVTEITVEHLRALVGKFVDIVYL